MNLKWLFFAVQTIAFLTISYALYLTINEDFVLREVVGAQTLSWFETDFPFPFVANFVLVLVLATITSHILFARTLIAPKRALSIPKHGKALIKAIDYVWYLSAAIFALLIVHDLQRDLIETALEWHDSEIDRLDAYGQRDFSEEEFACKLITKDNSRLIDGFLVEELGWTSKVCNEHILSVRDRALYYALETCKESQLSFYPSEDAGVHVSERVPEEIESALNVIYSFCYPFVRTADIQDDRSEFAAIKKKMDFIPEPTELLWLRFLFAFAIGLKLTKTTSDVIDALKKT